MRKLLLIALVVLGCGKKSEDAKPASGSAVASNADMGGTNVTEEPMAPGASVSGIDLSALGTKLKFQKDHRGTGPSTDKVFEALDKAGYKIEKRKQVLGDAANASFCENGRTAGLVVVVCEYGSDKDAQAGKAVVEQAWKQLDGKVERTVRGATVITVVHGGNKTADVPKILAAVNAV